MPVFFMFDIDETILTMHRRIGKIHDEIPCDIAQYSPYEDFGYTEKCYVLNKTKMAALFAKILENGHRIGFITAGAITKEGIKKFIKNEYGIELGDAFDHYNEMDNKTVILRSISKENMCLREDIYLIDDNSDNIKDANMNGFSTIYVDTYKNSVSPGNSPGSYVSELEKVLEKLQLAEKNNEEKAPFIPEKFLKFPRIILGNIEVKAEEVEAKLSESKNPPGNSPHQQQGFFSKLHKSAKHRVQSINFTKCLTNCFARSR